MLGLALFEFGEIKPSLKAYERAYQLDPKNVGSHSRNPVFAPRIHQCWNMVYTITRKHTII
jgi:hypothetical protein